MILTHAALYGQQLTRSSIYDEGGGSGPTPLTFEQAAVATVRRPRARVTITWSGPDIDNIEVTGIDGTRLNGMHENRPWLPRQIADSITSVPKKWFHLDGSTPINQMYLGPSTEESAASNQVGWWGAEVAGVGGVFTNPQKIQIRFSSSPIKALLVVGDSAYQEYPVDFTIQVFKDFDLLYTVKVTENDAVTWEHTVTEDIFSANIIILTITKWSRAGTVAKIAECYTSIQEVYDGDEIVSLSILEEMEIREGSLPIGNISSNELELELNNVDDKFFPGNVAAEYHESVKKNRKIFVELGFYIEGRGEVFVPMGTYWSGDWKVQELGTTASTTARDRMEFLRKSTFYPGTLFENVTLYDLAQTVLEDAQTVIPTLEYNISTDLQANKYIIPRAWFKKTSHFDALRDIAAACLGRVYADRDGIIQVLGPVEPGESSRTITSENYFERTQPANSEDIANRIEVTTQPLVSKTLETVYTSSEDIQIQVGTLQKFTCVYSSPPVTDAVASPEYPDDGAASVTIDGSTKYYAWGADVYVNCAIAGLFRIKIEGIPYEVGGKEIIVSEDSDSKFEYGEQRYEYKDNHLVQSRELAKDIADSLLASFKDPGKDIDIDWRGNPNVKLADIVQLPQYVKNGYSNYADVSVYRQKISFDGGLRSELSGRRIRSIVSSYQDTDEATTVWQDTDDATTIQG